MNGEITKEKLLNYYKSLHKNFYFNQKLKRENISFNELYDTISLINPGSLYTIFIEVPSDHYLIK